MIVTGPWNLGEFRRRLPAELQDAWATAPLPGPDGAGLGVSLAGGSSLVVFRSSRHQDAAWQFVEYLLRPEVQRRFYQLTGDLPACREAWAAPEIVADSSLVAFRTQLEHVVSTPKIPEWEQIAYRLQLRAETAVRGDADGRGRPGGARRRRGPHPREAALALARGLTPEDREGSP